MEFSKVVKFKLEGLKLHIAVDGDQDGQPVFVGTLDIPEGASELLSVFKPKAE